MRQMREAFEAWATTGAGENLVPSLATWRKGQYVNATTNAQWCAWCAALSAVPAQEPVSFVRERAQLEQEWVELQQLKKAYVQEPVNIKTAEERLKDPKHDETPVGEHHALLRKYKEEEIAELRAALEAEQLMTDVLRRQFMSKSHEFDLLQAKNAAQAKRIAELELSSTRYDTATHKIVPIEPTEEMIQQGCMTQARDEHATYEDWWNTHSSGVSRIIRDLIAKDYRAMIAAAPEVI